MYLAPLFGDEDVVAVAKPPGLLTHPTEVDGIAESATGAVRNASGRTHLGIHQRLDRDTSGILIFGCSGAADRGLAHSFSSHDAVKTYYAVVHGCPRQSAGTIDMPLSLPGPDGRVTVRHNGGKEASTAYRVVASDRRTGISVIEAQPRTGRTHQVRAHLAAMGCSVAGDGLYDPLRRPAPRLCLHAAALSLPHPTRHEHLDLRSSPPVELADLSRAVTIMDVTRKLHEAGAAAPTLARAGTPGLRDLIMLALGRREALATDQSGTAFRLINGSGDGVPGITVDQFGDLLTVNYYDEDARSDSPSAIVDHLIDLLDPRLVHVRVRPRRTGPTTDNGIFRRGPSDLTGGTAGEIVVADDGLSYLVRPAAGVNSGLFLDMREVRAWIRRHVAGQSVLNLFAYTCAFGVAAMAGNAARVLNLDAARPALQWGKENYLLNDLTVDDHDFVDGDVFDWLVRLARRKQTFDLVIADPPSFATTHNSRFVARRDYRTLAAHAAAVVSPGGTLLACCNLASLSAADFRRAVRGGVSDSGRQATLMATANEPGVDFPRALGGEGYLKIAVMRVD